MLYNLFRQKCINAVIIAFLCLGAQSSSVNAMLRILDDGGIAKQPEGVGTCGSYAVAFAHIFANAAGVSDFGKEAVDKVLEKFAKEEIVLVSPENTNLKSRLSESFKIGTIDKINSLDECADIASVAQFMAINESCMRVGFYILLKAPEKTEAALAHWVFMGIQRGPVYVDVDTFSFIVPESAHSNIARKYENQLTNILLKFKNQYLDAWIKTKIFIMNLSDKDKAAAIDTLCRYTLEEKQAIRDAFDPLQNVDIYRLHIAVIINNKLLVESLLNQGMLVNQMTYKQNDTPLHLAALDERKEVVELLLSKGAKIEAKNKDGCTPLHLAVCFGYKDVIELLLAEKADFKAKNNDGYTPLHHAACCGRKDVVSLLLEKGANIGASTNNKLTPLHCAIINGHIEIIYIFLQRKKDLSLPSSPENLRINLKTIAALIDWGFLTTGSDYTWFRETSKYLEYDVVLKAIMHDRLGIDATKDSFDVAKKNIHREAYNLGQTLTVNKAAKISFLAKYQKDATDAECFHKALNDQSCCILEFFLDYFKANKTLTTVINESIDILQKDTPLIYALRWLIVNTTALDCFETNEVFIGSARMVALLIRYGAKIDVPLIDKLFKDYQENMNIPRAKKILLNLLDKRVLKECEAGETAKRKECEAEETAERKKYEAEEQESQKSLETQRREVCVKIDEKNFIAGLLEEMLNRLSLDVSSPKGSQAADAPTAPKPLEEVLLKEFNQLAVDTSSKEVPTEPATTITVQNKPKAKTSKQKTISTKKVSTSYALPTCNEVQCQVCLTPRRMNTVQVKVKSDPNRNIKFTPEALGFLQYIVESDCKEESNKLACPKATQKSSHTHCGSDAFYDFHDSVKSQLACWMRDAVKFYELTESTKPTQSDCLDHGFTMGLFCEALQRGRAYIQERSTKPPCLMIVAPVDRDLPETFGMISPNEKHFITICFDLTQEYAIGNCFHLCLQPKHPSIIPIVPGSATLKYLLAPIDVTCSVLEGGRLSLKVSKKRAQAAGKYLQEMRQFSCSQEQRDQDAFKTRYLDKISTDNVEENESEESSSED